MTPKYICWLEQDENGTLFYMLNHQLLRMPEKTTRELITSKEHFMGKGVYDHDMTFNENVKRQLSHAPTP